MILFRPKNFLISFLCIATCFNCFFIGLKAHSEEENLNSNDSSTSADNDLSPVSLKKAKENEAYFEGDSIDYDPETGSFLIEGAAILYLNKQGIKLAADQIEYLPKEDRLKAIGNVMITGKEQVTFAKDLDLDLKNNDALLGDVKSQIALASIEAREASLKSTPSMRTGDYTDGAFDLAEPIRLGATPAGAVSFRLSKTLVESRDEILENGQSFTLQARKLVYYPDRIQNNLYVYGGKLKFKKVPLTLPLPFGVFTAGESSQQMFSAILGNNPRTGAGDFNIGPKISLVLGDPKKERAISVAPFFQLGSSAGAGGMVQYTDPRNSALLAYGSAKDRGLAEVTSRLTENNNFVYGWNSYLGGGITRQFAQLNDRRNIKIPFLTSFFEGERISVWSDASFARDSQELRNEENNLFSRLQRDSLGSNVPFTRDKSGFRFQESIFFSTKPVIEIGTEKHNIALRGRATATARAYSTGNTNSFASVGPNIRIHASHFADLEVGYDQLINQGRSPFGFDQVIQGQESAYANGDFNFTKWLTIGGFGVYSFTRQNWVAQQARLVVGPEDFKLLFSYDPVRRQFNFGFTVFFDDKVGFRQFSYRKNTSGKKRRF